MRRRRYLAALGAGASGLLAGCSDSADPTTAGSPSPTSTTSSTPGESTPPVSETFEVTKREPTDTTRLNDIWAFGFSVRNTTDAPHTFRSTISARVDGGEWRQFDRSLSIALDPGETKTWQSPRLKFRFLRTYSYRLDATGTVWSVEVLPLHLDYGRTYTSPVGLQITVDTVTFRNAKPGTTGNRTATTTPTPPPPTAADTGGTKWAVVPVSVENPTDRARSAPFPKEFTFRANGRTYEDVPLDHPDLYHRDRALETGEPLSGNLYYEVPAGLDANDIEFVLQRSYDQQDLSGDIEVVWSR